MDWKSTAKTGEPHIKRFYEEREVNVAICTLLSGSLLFKEKKNRLLEVTALLGYETIKTGNQLTPIMISQNKELFLPASKKIHAVEHFIKEIDKVPLENRQLETNTLSQKIHKHLKKKSFVILIGDFLGDFDFAPLAQRHALHLIMIRDTFEENPQALGDGEFRDPESGESANFYFSKSAAKAYAKRYHDNDTKLYKHLQSLGISYHKVITLS